MKIIKHITFIIIAGFILLLAGCAGSTHSTVYFEGYYDPYPYWGYGDDTTIIIDLPDRKDLPSKRPPGINPPGGGRSKPSPRRG